MRGPIVFLTLCTALFKHVNVVIFIKFILTNMKNNQFIKTGSTLLAIVLSFRYVRKNMHMYTHIQTYVYAYIHMYTLIYVNNT